MKLKIAVIGGGAAGMMAAIVAARNGAEVCIYEKSNRLGKKILATGNGRCNYTNINTSVNDYHGNNLSFVEEVINSFDVNNTIDFFRGIGIHPRVAENGKVYPYSLQASSVLDNLRYELDKYKIKEMTEHRVKSLRKNKAVFDIITEAGIYTADKVIITTGGRAGLQYGCTGDGYELAKIFGHKIINQFPALVQLKLNADYLKKISGVRFDGAVSCYSESGLVRSVEEEILFTDYGISGPSVLQISREAINLIYNKKKSYIVVDIFPEFSKNELFELLSERFSKLKDRSIEESFNGFIHKKLIPVILSLADIKFDDKLVGMQDKCYKLNKKNIYSIINVLKEWKIEVVGHNDWQQAQTTAGGVCVDEIDSKTMESKKEKGLYFAGEVLDVDGDCGGFNLQWAWSSGYLAGYSASTSV